MRPAVFLDRDNTLMANDGDCGDPAAVRLLPEVPEGLLVLRSRGFRLVVVSNQGGVARGAFSESDVVAVNARLAALLDAATNVPGTIDRFYWCPFHPDAAIETYRGDHPWRKPNPGMLHRAAADLDLDLARSWIIGDAVRDAEAGRRAGCRSVLLAPARPPELAAETICAPSFAAAVIAIIGAIDKAPGAGWSDEPALDERGIDGRGRDG
ncbi:MAG: HAD-IIIA family hydrolase [Phycisphaerales bacterium]